MITAVTGGIGSGKSWFCNLLRKQGVRVYDCDARARSLMAESRSIQKALSALVGRDLFPGGTIDKAALRSFITSSSVNTQKVNGIVHPAVAQDFLSSGCTWLESAILFESGFFKRLHFDRVICVTAPLDIRIQRIMERDRCTLEQATAWINAQMPQEEKAALADYVIVNDNNRDLLSQLPFNI